MITNRDITQPLRVGLVETAFQAAAHQRANALVDSAAVPNRKSLRPESRSQALV